MAQDDPPDGRAVIAFVQASVTPDGLRRGWETLDESERLRADGFRVDSARELFVMGRSTARIGLGLRLGIAPRDVRLAVSPRGKPGLAGPPDPDGWQFNVVHSGTLAVVAFALGLPVGIDVESMASIPAHETDALAASHFSEGERREWNQSRGAGIVAGFLRVWTRKEAVLKASGEGLVDDLPSVDTSLRGPVGGKWGVREIGMPVGYVGSVASEGLDWIAVAARE